MKRKKNGRVETLEQWVEVRVEDGRTVTRLFPSNAVLRKEAEERGEKPDFVYRRLHFVGGIPREYYWTTRSAERRRRGGCGIQRMRYDTWLEAVQEEEAAGHGHVGRCYRPVPRPEERGGCGCEVCG